MRGLSIQPVLEAAQRWADKLRRDLIARIRIPVGVPYGIMSSFPFVSNKLVHKSTNTGLSSTTSAPRGGDIEDKERGVFSLFQ